KLGGHELLFLLDHVAAVLDGREYWGIRGGPPDSLLFEHLDQGSLGIAGWWLREVLVGPQLQKVEQLPLGEWRQRALFQFILGIARVVPLLVNGNEALELDDRAGCPEGV